MKSAIFVSLVVLTAPAVAEPRPGMEKDWRVAYSASACLTTCASQSDACKRMCPTTYSGPCVSACDNQEQFCRQACQQK